MIAARPTLFVFASTVLSVLLIGQAPEEFQSRRDACRKLMSPGEVLVLESAAERGDRPDSNLYYLTGMTQPGGALILRADGGEILFGAPSRRRRAAGGLSRAGAVAGIEDTKPTSALAAELERLESDSLTIVDGRRARTICGRLRRIKSPVEIERLRKAIDITCAAHREVMRSAAPGMYEYQLQAIIEYVFAFNGSERVGFSSILGSGPNSCTLHWSENTRLTQPGDVVVMDIGAEYGMYTADVTRTIPINGKFTNRQRQVYEIVLAANEAAIDMIRPGINMRDINAKVNEVLTAGLAEMGVIEPGDRRGLRKYYYHGLSHPIGLVVHDVGGLGELEPGMVLTIEPGLYFREEGMGFRIEDDVLVTDTGCVVLSAAAPKQVAEVEALMAQPGMDVSRIAVPKSNDSGTSR